MPLPDTFTGSNGTALSSYDSNWVQNSAYSGVLEIQGNTCKLRTSGAANAVYVYDQAPGSADYEVTGVFNFSSTGNNSAGLVARASKTANTLYMFRLEGSNVNIYKFVSGTATQLGSSVASGIGTNTNTTLKLTVTGTAIKGFVDGVEKISVTDSAISATGYPGLRFVSSATLISADSFDYTNRSSVQNLAASGAAQAVGSADAAFSLAVAGAGVAVSSGSAQQAAAISMSAIGVAQAAGQGGNTIAISLSAAGLAEALGSAGLVSDSQQSLAAAGAAVASGSASITLQLDLAAVGDAAALGSATQRIDIALSAAALAQAAGSGELVIHASLEAIGAGQAAGTATLQLFEVSTDELYPLAGAPQAFKLAGQTQGFPLAGQTQTFISE